jgi:hypothetical protein
MVCCPLRGSRLPLGRPSWRLPSRARVPLYGIERRGAAGLSVTESHLPGARGSGALIRPSLGAGQLNRIGALLAGTEGVREPAAPLKRLGIGPGRQMLPAPDAAGLDIALLTHSLNRRYPTPSSSVRSQSHHSSVARHSAGRRSPSLNDLCLKALAGCTKLFGANYYPGYHPRPSSTS